MGNKFHPFSIEASPILVKRFEKERIYREIYEETGSHGQGTPGSSFPSDNEDSDQILEEDPEDMISTVVSKRGQ